MPTRGLLLLAVVTMVAVVVSWFALGERYRHANPETREGGRIFPVLLESTRDVVTLEVARAGDRFTLERRDGDWANLAVGGFPAEGDQVEAAIHGIASLRYLAPKTARRALHSKLGVEEVAVGASSTRLTLRNGQGAVVADIIVGKAKARIGVSGRPGVYVRLPDDERAWLADGTLNVHRDPADWSEREVVDIDAESIRSITARHASGDTVDLYRARPEDGKLTLRTLPPGAAIEHQHQIDFMSGLLTGLKFLDARPGSLSDEPMIVAKVRTTDHLRVTLRAGPPAADGSLWATVDAGLTDEARATDQARHLALRINERFTGWTLKLPRTISDKLNIRLHDILGALSTGNKKKTSWKASSC